MGSHAYQAYCRVGDKPELAFLTTQAYFLVEEVSLSRAFLLPGLIIRDSGKPGSVIPSPQAYFSDERVSLDRPFLLSGLTVDKSSMTDSPFSKGHLLF